MVILIFFNSKPSLLPLYLNKKFSVNVDVIFEFLESKKRIKYGTPEVGDIHNNFLPITRPCYSIEFIESF